LTLLCRRMHSADPTESCSHFSTSTATGTLRQHLYKFHLDKWVAECDKLNIKITAKDAQSVVDSYRQRKGQVSKQENADLGPHKKYSPEAFVDALVEFIVVDDQVSVLLLLGSNIDILLQSINIIESPYLHAIFLMLREKLENSDIPGRSTICARIHEMLDGHLEHLEGEMQVCHLLY